MSENRHPGINMHKLPVGGGLIGLLFALGSALIFVLGFPTLWYFVFLSGGLGVCIALLIRFVNQDRPDRNKPLSILAVNGTSPKSARTEVRDDDRDDDRDNGIQFRAVPGLTTA